MSVFCNVYNRINPSYNKTLIFHIGCDSGFFSEYLGMIFAISYCKLNNINFKLYSKNSNFSYSNGWTDYFNPFCEEVYDDVHSIFNRRQRFPKIKAIIKSLYFKVAQNRTIPPYMFERFKLGMLLQFMQEPFIKKKYGFDYYTFEIWSKISNYYSYDRIMMQNTWFDSLSYTGNLRNLFKQGIKDTWRFSKDVELELDRIITTLNLPKNYVGMHIRAGDKVQEDKIYDIEDYFKLLEIHNSSLRLNNIFLFTDDYRIVSKAKKNYPMYNIFTLCQENELGYDNEEMNNKSLNEKKESRFLLFSSIQLLVKSDLFIGVYNSNPDMFIDIVRDSDTFFVDIDEIS